MSSQPDQLTINRQRLLERFLRYVVVDTTADEKATNYPSSAGQLELGKLLAQELIQMGAADVEHDENGLVWATIPANVAHDAPVIAFNSHMDTSPETSGENVQPRVIENYDVEDITLSGDTTQVIRVDDNPELAKLRGCTLITTDGTTLLGGDDKAGLAIIMELAEHLLGNPQLPRGKIRLLFTCDEEIGRGVDKVDTGKVGAVACYTLDGGGANEIDIETFSADLATIIVRGVNIHPSIGRNRLVNAIRAAGAFLEKLPPEMSPERTQGREGFIHPYSMEGGVAEINMRLILRDFNTAKLPEQASIIRLAAAQAEQQFPGCSFALQFTPQYRNMADGLQKEPRAVELARRAHENLGRTPKLSIVRGGTDGSQLTERGLPTPNLSSGQHNLHSPLEWACLDEMILACEASVELARLWSEEPAKAD